MNYPPLPTFNYGWDTLVPSPLPQFPSTPKQDGSKIKTFYEILI